MTTTRLLRTFVVTATLALSAIAMLAIASPAIAASDCGKKVLADWYDNGRIDRLYPLNCYEDAIDAIPSDIGPYVDAEEVITRALQSALNNKLAPGGCDPSADGSADDCANQSGGGSGNGGGGNGGGGNGNGEEDPGSGGTGSGETPTAAPGVNTSGPSSVPIPLLVLGGMSIVLLAAGGLGYLSRRRQATRAHGPDDLL
ncbi:MAG TPA: hypothetical protein VFU99_05285 [Gaiellaceae bacterium]|nr:hypothetical protein [Gaiellaceae bacterium]